MAVPTVADVTQYSRGPQFIPARWRALRAGNTVPGNCRFSYPLPPCAHNFFYCADRFICARAVCDWKFFQRADRFIRQTAVV